MRIIAVMTMTVPKKTQVKRARLNWLQKYGIALECERLGITGGTRRLNDVAKWAQKQFKLSLVPSARTILRIICSKSVIEDHRTERIYVHANYSRVGQLQ